MRMASNPSTQWDKPYFEKIVLVDISLRPSFVRPTCDDKQYEQDINDWFDSLDLWDFSPMSYLRSHLTRDPFSTIWCTALNESTYNAIKDNKYFSITEPAMYIQEYITKKDTHETH